MKTSIFVKIFSGFLLLTLLLSGSTGIIIYQHVRSFHIETLVTDMTKIGKSLNINLSPLLEPGRQEELDDFVRSFADDVGIRITVVKENGTVLVESDENSAEMEDHKFRPEIIRAFTGTPASSLRFSRTVKAQMLYLGLPIYKKGRVSHVLRLSLYLNDINTLLKKLRADMLRVTAIISLLALVAAIIYTRRLTRPIRDLSQASRRIASGDFSAKTLIRKQDELRDLSESFNFMTDRIRHLFAELAAQKEEVKGILDSMEEGLITIASDGKILRGNSSFARISGQADLKGKFYWEVIRAPDFGDLIRKNQEKGLRQSGEVKINERTYLGTVSRPDGQDELIVTLHDITEIKQLDKLKKDFIVNVSHELRTPLTSIKGYLETLEDGVDEEHRRFLENAMRNTDRLALIVKDLLSLSELESRAIDIQKEPVDLRIMIDAVVSIFEPRIREKGLNISIEIEEDCPQIMGDAFRLEQMLSNLLDNAVRHTEEGLITITAACRGQRVLLSIRDTGIGIPEIHIPRLFERFYTVDASRSRRMGGTGLGLSIVKHIVQLHSGDISLESTEGSGTRFDILFPAD